MRSDDTGIAGKVACRENKELETQKHLNGVFVLIEVILFCMVRCVTVFIACKFTEDEMLLKVHRKGSKENEFEIISVLDAESLVLMAIAKKRTHG